MDYKEKYIRALERARKIHHETEFDYEKGMMEEIFPEIKDSEDERIMKAIKGGIRHLETQLGYDAVDGVDILDMYSWLEKQDEKTNPYSGMSFEYNGHIWGMCARDNGIEIAMDGKPVRHFSYKDCEQTFGGKSALEAIKEEKVDNANKVEPKFKIGDWVVLTAGELSTTLQIVNVDTNKKLYWFNDDSYLPIVDEECLHLWTIADAKDGDVLYYHVSATNFFQQIAIFKRVASKDELLGQTYRNYVQYGGFGGIENYTLQVALGDNELHHCGSTACPATKEQRDLLFQKMKEAGYEWDGEKKELKKIEPKKLDPDKVIEWLKAKVYDDSTYGMAMIDKFKKDFGLWNDKKN